MNSPDLERDLAGARSAHARLLVTIAGLTDSQARQPSLLPDWSVGHVLTHIARNADGMLRMTTAAERGEVAAMYAGGVAGRVADIEAGAGRSATELSDDVRASVDRLESAWAAATPTGWAGRGVTMVGDLAITEVPARRWRETEVHHADLGLGYRFEDWPADYVRLELVRMTAQWASRKPMGLTDLPAAVLAVTPNVRLAWLFGRHEIDGVPAAGVF